MTVPEYLAELHDHYRDLAVRKARSLTADQSRSLLYFRAELAVAINPRLFVEARDRITVWVTHALEIDTFVLVHGQVPRRNNRRGNSPRSDSDRQLTTWLEDQRRPAARLRQCSYQRQRIDAYPGVDTRSYDVRWAESLDAYADFIVAARRAPAARSEDPVERSLGHWAAKQRKSYRDGTLSKERTLALNALPFWTWGARQPKS